VTAIRVEVLGPLRLFVDDRPVDVRGPKRRAVLALLAMAQGRALTVDHLLDALWPAELPDSARGALHSHVFRLRGQLGPAGARLETLDSAYRLAADLDLARARALRAAARDADPAAAYTLLREAHGLWRGPVLAEFGEVAPLVAAAAGIAQLRTEVTDALVSAGVDAGRASEVHGLSADTLAAEPLREPAVLLRMRALAATGQAADALAAGREYRHRLAEEAGLDPSPALGELERDVATGAAAGPAAPVQPLPRAAPRPVTPLVGRDAQVAAVHRLLDAERLVTVLGPGGVGKTRLALEVAGRREPAGVLLLASVTAADAIPHALAAALNLQVTRGNVLAACVAHLAAGPGLLLVDNCEHLLDGVRDAVAALLDGCAQLTVLATSREPLGLPGECASRLAPLPVPAAEDGRALERVPAVEVFLDRAARVRPGFAPDADELRLVAGIVRRLDGMPLAIELAAGRLSTFSLAELADRLQRSLDLLGGARPAPDARHRTLRATIDWSYRLLPEPKQRLFRHLAVFPDGVDLATAEAVAADLGAGGDPAAALAHLVDGSMIDAAASAAGTRYRMLETLRAFGLDRLAAAGELDAAAQRLLAWARDLTGWIDATVIGPDEPWADAALRRELPNLRAAWRLARERGDVDTAGAMVARLHMAVVWRDLIEIRGWAEELAGQPGVPPVVLAAAARAAYMRGDSDTAERRARACLDSGGDAAGWHGSNALALVHLARGEFGQVIERELDAAALATHADGSLGVAALAATYAGDHDRARELNGRLAADAASPTLRAFTAYVGGEIDSAAGNPAAAQEHYARAIKLARASGATFVVSVASVGRLTVLVETGRHADALDGYRDVIDYFARTGNWSHLWTTLRNLVRLLRRLGDEPTADLLDAAADHAPDAPPVPGRRPAPGVPGSGVRRRCASRGRSSTNTSLRPG
jgi:predicted ATPase/DNA-binding SARP family transcriptional activator